jgi:hypothetical protein
MKDMKTRLFILLGIIITIFSACNLNGSSNYSPEMYVYTSHINRNDTLNIYFTDEGGVMRLDTINVGDTIVFRMFLDGITNNLTNFYLTQSDTISSKILLPSVVSMDSIFSKTQSDYNAGRFVFLPNKRQVYIPVRYIAKNPSSTATIQFTITSDAVLDNSVGSNSATLKLKTPILVAKTSKIK